MADIVKTETQNLPAEINGGFNTAMKIAEELAKSDIIPKEFQKKPANCLIAVELANRLKASPFQVMQNMDVIYGRPALRSAFIIACINNSGKIIGSLKFEMNEKTTKCRAWAIEKETGARLYGPTITLEMAEKEGWLTKSGSKWKTMPDLMLRYRAASFFGRLYCPEILNGMYSEDEITDMKSAENMTATDIFAEPEVFPEEPAKGEEMEITQEMEDAANAYFEAHEQ
jgi:hypothetical protein|nr:MAG TPA: RecT protein [Caudoviricetes sp.]